MAHLIMENTRVKCIQDLETFLIAEHELNSCTE